MAGVNMKFFFCSSDTHKMSVRYEKNSVLFFAIPTFLTHQANNSVAGIARAIFERQFRYLVSKCNETLVDPTMRRLKLTLTKSTIVLTFCC